MSKIKVPRGAQSIVLGLRYANHAAYVVGGCVRDSLLGVEPKDWDICTSATPSEMKHHFNRLGIQTIDTGLKHGTITVKLGDSELYEVTTFRADGDYSDNRHPDSVEFVDSIYKDLARRDFTINAMAYNSAGLIDPYYGRQDLVDGVIRCVGNPDDRFNEDALRILRAMRFASVYGFAIEENTSESIHRNKELLENISAERIQSELCKMLCGKGVLNVLLEYSLVLTRIIAITNIQFMNTLRTQLPTIRELIFPLRSRCYFTILVSLSVIQRMKTADISTGTLFPVEKSLKPL